MTISDDQRHLKAILERLRRGPATSRELTEICFGYRARISQARQLGCHIKCDRGEPSTFTLLSEPSPEKPAPVAPNGQLGMAAVLR